MKVVRSEFVVVSGGDTFVVEFQNGITVRRLGVSREWTITSPERLRPCPTHAMHAVRIATNTRTKEQVERERLCKEFRKKTSKNG